MNVALKDGPTRRWVTWAKALGTGIAVPILVLGLAEAVLRVAGVGYATPFFRSAPGNAVTSNPRFGWRFFPRILARTPAVFLYPQEKAPETFRIFVLGGSAAMGTPDAAFSFGRVLEVMLAETRPERHVEVINAAMTAINSHVVREIAADCAGRSPDLFVVYLGNNEVVGPYGPGTVFQSTTPPIAMIRLGMTVKRLRLAQSLAEGMRRLSGSETPASWQGMEMFLNHTVTADDPRLEAVYANFRSNLEAIVAAAGASGAPVVLSTVATNVKDCPPFASVHDRGLTSERLAIFEAAYRRGLVASAQGRADEGVEAYREAAAVDAGYAELRYVTGRTLLHAGRREEAMAELTAARDLDALRFRADTRINGIIRQVAESNGTLFVDAAKALEEAGEDDAISGSGLFFEHVHLRFAGNYRLAAEVYERVEEVLRDGGHRSPPLPERCAELLALTPWDSYRMQAEIDGMMRRPPFTAQLDHSRRRAEHVTALREIRRASHEALESCEQAHRRARTLRPGDVDVTVKLAELLGERGQHDEAVVLWRVLLARVPGVEEWRTALAFELLDSGATLEAAALMGEIAEGRAWDPEAWVNLAALQSERGETAAAESALRRAMEISPRGEEARLALASLLAEDGRLDAALDLCRDVLRLHPRDPGARFTLATVLERQGRPEDAVAEYRAAVEENPDMVRAWNNLGHLLSSMRRPEEAEVAFREAIAADPWHALARFNMADLALATGRPKEAVEEYRTGLALEPGNLAAAVNLAVTHQLLGEPVEAAAQFRSVLRVAPESPLALRGLAWLLATEPSVANPGEALERAREAVAITGGRDVDALETLAVAYLANGERDRAAETVQRALVFTSDESQASRLTTLMSRVANGRPVGRPAQSR